MKYKIVIVMIFLLALSLSTAYAGNDRRVGTAGATELLLPIGSRGVALGGSVLSTISGVEAMYWNPAGLASMEGSQVMFSHIPYIADIDVDFIGFSKYIEGFGAIGAGAKIVNVGDIEETTTDSPEGTGRIFSPTLTVMNVSFAKILTANVSFGLSAMFIHENIFEVQASGLAFDAGFIYNPRWNGLTLGVTIKNYGGNIEFDGIGFDRVVNSRPMRGNNASAELPSSINFGFAYDLYNEGLNSASFSGTFQSNNFSQDVWNGGLEYMYDNLYSLRAGYNYSDRSNYLYGASFGAGVKFALGDMDLMLEYTWTQTEVFDNNQYFTLTTDF